MITNEKIIESILFAINMKKTISETMLNPKRTCKFSKPPKKFYRKYEIDEFSVQGRKCFTLKLDAAPKKHIVFLHGGGYSAEPTIVHWNMVDFILRQMSAHVTFIDYPLAPEHTCFDCLGMVVDAYTELFKDDAQEIILMGDSAGGGLALALAQHINYLKMSIKPKKIILLSPWLDVSMEDEIPTELAKSDPVLDVDTLKTLGKSYAGDIDMKDYRCSPLFGSLENLGDIALFIGTHDILYVQAEKFKEKMIGVSGKFDYYKYESAIHDWMLNMLPRATEAKKEIIEFIKQK